MVTVLSAQIAKARAALIADLRREIRDERVLAAMERVPRELFVPEGMARFAYANQPLPIGYGQTISQPLIVALMTQALALTGNEKVLEIGTGSGYQAAILAQLAEQVVSVERIPELAWAAARRLRELGYTNVQVHAMPHGLGYPKVAPYDAIIVTAGAPGLPHELLRQLAENGRMIVPVGERQSQELLLLRKSGGLQVEKLGGCRFVPLIGTGAWPDISHN